MLTRVLQLKEVVLDLAAAHAGHDRIWKALETLELAVRDSEREQIVHDIEQRQAIARDK